MILTFGACVMDTKRRQLRREGDFVALEPQTFDLLEYLIQNRERVVSRDDLISAVWKGRIVSDSALGSRIHAVRAAIGDNGTSQNLIKTFSRKGVRFVGNVLEEPIFVGSERVATSFGRPIIEVIPFAEERKIGSRSSWGRIDLDIVTSLVRFSNVTVVFQNSAVSAGEVNPGTNYAFGNKYILYGSWLQSLSDVRLHVRLSDAASGVVFWSSQYRHRWGLSSKPQEELARTIADLVVAHAQRFEAGKLPNRAPSTWRPYHYCLLASEMIDEFWICGDPTLLHSARRRLEKSLVIKPDCAQTHALLADTYLAGYQRPCDGDYLNPAALDRAHLFVSRAKRHDRNAPLAYVVNSCVLGLKREHEASLAELARASVLHPDFVDWRIPMVLIMAGQHERAVEAAISYLRTDPFYPPRAALWLGAAYFMLGRHAEAEKYFLECLANAPDSRGSQLWAAANYAKLNRFKEAERRISAALRLDPQISMRVQARLSAVCARQEDVVYHLDGLRRAGLPEG